MKKRIWMIVAAILMMSVCAAAQEGTLSVYVNGQAVESDVPPTIMENRTMLPFRAVCEAMRCEVTWDDTARAAMVTNDEYVLTAKPDVPTLLRTAVSDNTETVIELDMPPVIVESRLLLPVRAFAEAFGAEVTWSEKTRTVGIAYDKLLTHGVGAGNRGNNSFITSADREARFYIDLNTGALLNTIQPELAPIANATGVIEYEGDLYYVDIEDHCLYRYRDGENDLRIYQEAVSYPLFYQGELYAILKSGSLCRIKDGAATELLSQAIQFFDIDGDKLYYVLESDYALYEAPLLNPQKAQKLVDGMVAYPNITDTAIYYSHYDEENERVTVEAYTFQDKKTSVLCEGVYATQLNYYNGYLYFTESFETGFIYRLKADGTERPEPITDQPAIFPQICNGRIYYAVMAEGDVIEWHMCYEDQPAGTPTKALPAYKEELRAGQEDYKVFTPTFKKTDRPQAVITVKDFGTVTVELRPDAAPQTVENFVSLAKSGFYNGLTFHRVVQNFMIQGGDPKGNGTGGPGYTILGEFSQNGQQNPLSHTRGAVSMARSADPNSGGSQFFICDSDDAFLDGAYAVFGYVVSGMDVVDAIAKTEVIDTTGETSTPKTPIVIESVTIRE